MIGKDKKPFTYTPGGIDLSEIRSPRMQRRICRNAAAEGVSVPPPPPTPPSPQTGGIPRPPPMHPQLAVAVLPPPPPMNKMDTPPTPSAVKMMPPVKNNVEKTPINSAVTLNNNGNGNNNMEAKKPPTSVYIPQQTMNSNVGMGSANFGNGNKPMQQTGHIYVAPVPPTAEPAQAITSQLGSLYIPAVPPTPQTPQSQSPGSPLQVNLNQAAKPWLNSQNRQQPMSPQTMAPHVVQHVAPRQPPQSPPVGVWSPPNTPSTRIIPIQVNLLLRIMEIRMGD